MSPAVSSRLSWLGIGREAYPGIPVLPTAAVPVSQDAYEPEDTPGWLLDTGLRAAMGNVAGVIQGTLDAAHGFGAPFYCDSGGFWLDNLLGDVSTVPSGGVVITGPARALAVPLNPGDTQLTAVASLNGNPPNVATGATVAINDGAASEVVVATPVSTSTTVKFAGTPCRFAHAVTATAQVITTSTYTHTFSALNSGTGQPPSHTLTDTSGLTAGTGARWYPAAAVAQIDLAGDPGGGWITGKVTGASWLSQPTTATPVNPGYAAAAAFPGWYSEVTVGSGAGNPAAWAVTLKRDMVIYRSPDNGQTPVVFARGGITATGALAYPGAVDETALAQMETGGPLPLVISAGNGLSGPAALALTITLPLAQFTRAKLSRSAPSLAYATTWQGIDNSTSAGGSGGLSPIQVQLSNSVAAY